MRTTPIDRFAARFAEARTGGESVVLDVDIEPIGRERFVDMLGRCQGEPHLDVIRGGVSERQVAPADAGDLIENLVREHASLRVRRIHCVDERLRDLAFAVHRALREEVNVNAYWSAPRAAMGLAPHADGHDIAVVQVAGKKRWTLFEREPRELTLEVGQALFVPRGLRHLAQNPHDEPTLHLAVGVYAKTTRSVVEWLASELSSDVELLDEEGMDAALISLRERVTCLLADPAARDRFAAYREGVEHERMLMSPTEHARSDARRYR
jgi:hypothetical protein